jgi:DNA-binding PadR family transcriptional regulator
LTEVSKERFFESHPLTATQIKKQMRDSYPLGLNHVIAALKFLEEHHLVETVDHTDKRELKIYQTTDLGRTILGHVLLPEKQLQHDTNPTR